MNLLSVYMSECRKKYRPLGFRRYRQTYARIVNDVLQSFTLKRFSSGRECNVVFSVYPLCIEIADPYEGSLYDLSAFRSEYDWRGWIYDKQIEESITSCVDDICCYIDAYLMPFFEEANCCNSTFQAMIEFEELSRLNHSIYYSRRAKEHGYTLERVIYAPRIQPAEAITLDELLSQARQDCEKQVELSYDPSWTAGIYMALKNGQYDYATDMLQKLIVREQEAFDRMKEQVGDDPKWQAYFGRFKRSIENWQGLYDRAVKNDRTYLDQLLRENELRSLENLKKCKIFPVSNS